MKKVLCAGVIFVMAAAAAVFAVLYFNKAAEVATGHLFIGAGKQWILAGDTQLFDITERAFNRFDLFGYPDGPETWMPVGAAGSPFKPHFASIGKTATMTDAEYVIGVVDNGVATAYPLKIVAQHQIVNDASQDAPLLVYFGNISRTAAAFRAVDGGETLVFASTGYLYRNVDLLYDLSRESLFLPATGMFVAGDRLGRTLEIVPSAVVPLGTWRKLYPQSRLMTENTDVASQKYPRMDALYAPLQLKYTARQSDDRRAAQTPVVVVMQGENTLAIPLEDASPAGPVPTTLGGRNLEVHFAEDGKAAWVTDAAGQIVPSIRTVWQVYSTVMPAPESK